MDCRDFIIITGNPGIIVGTLFLLQGYTCLFPVLPCMGLQCIYQDFSHANVWFKKKLDRLQYCITIMICPGFFLNQTLSFNYITLRRKLFLIWNTCWCSWPYGIHIFIWAVNNHFKPVSSTSMLTFMNKLWLSSTQVDI